MLAINILQTNVNIRSVQLIYIIYNSIKEVKSLFFEGVAVKQ